MTGRKSQLDRVRDRLHQRGLITRNECLSTFPAITRLGARIADLKQEGYVFKTEQRGGDFYYRLVSRPVAKTLALTI